MKEFKVAIIGQIARWKGQDILIKAAKRLQPKYPQMRFQIIGDVLFEKEEELRFKDYLIDLAKDYEYIQFLGHREDILKVLKDIDILVHASIREEPFGRVIIEGMASKKPVIAAGIGGPLEIIEDGISGILYEPGNEKELAFKLEELIKDERFYSIIANGGHKRFLEKFNIRSTVSKVEEYIELVSNK